MKRAIIIQGSTNVDHIKENKKLGLEKNLILLLKN